MSKKKIPNYVFVFGSNLAGRHGKGAALYAKKNFGAEYGVGEGRTGQSYALPTKDENLKSLPFSTVCENLDIFYEYAKKHPTTVFALTPVSTGLAGNSLEDLYYVMASSNTPENVLLTSSWIQ